VRGVGLNPTRVAGAGRAAAHGGGRDRPRRAHGGGEPAGDLTVRPARLHAADVGPAEIPGLVDELPALAVAQAFAEGTSTVHGAGELRVKESDRITTVANALRALGGKWSNRRTAGKSREGGSRGARWRARGNHRVAMALGVAGAGGKRAGSRCATGR